MLVACRIGDLMPGDYILHPTLSAYVRVDQVAFDIHHHDAQLERIVHWSAGELHGSFHGFLDEAVSREFGSAARTTTAVSS